MLGKPEDQPANGETHRSPKFELQLASAMPTSRIRRLSDQAKRFKPTKLQIAHVAILDG